MNPEQLSTLQVSEAMVELQAKIGYSFDRIDLLVEVLTHSSSLNEKRGSRSHNERLEFLGDAVLDLMISEYLMSRFREADEGSLSQMKARLVSKDILSKLSKHLALGTYLILGRGEELNDGRQKPSLLADTLEALIAAVYLDGGLSPARRLVLNIYREEFSPLSSNGHEVDDKSQLQELCQRRYGLLPIYQLRHTSGPDHHRTFEVEVHLKDERYGTGAGRTKKKAEQQAAKQALARLQESKV
ncbi:MAG TPA: ribonuclease III [Nitrospirales bacterium]|nr:ribonuclease III [Nitrospirales bacterium]